MASCWSVSRNRVFESEDDTVCMVLEHGIQGQFPSINGLRMHTVTLA